ncbi:DUF3658 domain-containing protein [Dysosmobacter sp.]|uniref:DUF3658 domain-containing protein n=1 Tax=Dysosmobacter sp. TaxID=2591382 RepID=UPI002A8FA3C0|nr:DUF3658 domain-containing protein [Dysosmobacter sp.]MDY3984571.1 DUF3658 domain-containing protein [Dysosmobacter sp.]
MLELCFDRSVRGSLCVAQHCGHGPLAVGVVNVGGAAMPEDVRRKAEERARQEAEERWKDAVSLGGVSEDVLCLSLALCFGDIQALLGEDCPRRDLLRRWYDDGWEEMEARGWQETMAALDRLRCLGPKEHIRVWADGLPDHLCGLLFAAEVLVETKTHVSAVFLPPWQERADGTLVRYQGWGEVAPEEFGRFLPMEQELSPMVLRMLAFRWKELKMENAPHRAVVNGRVRSVGEDFYDDCIRRALPAGRKKIAQVIGDILGRERPGIGDAWLADRVRVLVDAGEYRIAEEDPERFYRSILEKV